MTSQTTSEPQPIQPDEPQVEQAICETHGEFEQKVLVMVEGMRPIRSRCPKCDADRKAAEAETERRQKAAARAQEVADLQFDSDIPARFRDRSFAGYIPESKGAKIAVAVCKQYAETLGEQREGRSLVLTGGPGTGKTHLACAIAKRAIEEELMSVRFATVSDMLRQIKETYRKEATTTESAVIRSFVNCDLLIVDEVGVQVGSDHEKLLLFEILNGRYQDLAPTILISNLPLAELETFLGHRIMDRYRECGVVLAFDWASYRGKRAA
jgi:DNA replication protein DnaC